MFNAHVTTNPAGELTLGSMVTVEDDDGTVACNEVPMVTAGGIAFWLRVDAALRQVGWMVRLDTDHEAADGELRFNAVKI